MPDPANKPPPANGGHPANIIVSLMIDCPRWRDIDMGVPLENLLETLVKTTLLSVNPPVLSAAENIDVSITLMNDETIHGINREYRGKDKPTNVLSFPQLQPREVHLAEVSNSAFLPLGDILIALETIEREAKEEGKDLQDHLAHMVVHGCLHLLGYDHMTDDEAADMEGLETAILTGLGYEAPYSNDNKDLPDA